MDTTLNPQARLDILAKLDAERQRRYTILSHILSFTHSRRRDYVAGNRTSPFRVSPVSEWEEKEQEEDAQPTSK